jgi:hypothetical protein
MCIITANEDLQWKQYDIKTAFLLAKLKYEIYAAIPDGLVDYLTEKYKNCRIDELTGIANEELLQKFKKLGINEVEDLKRPEATENMCMYIQQSVYGTKQGAHDWYHTFRDWIVTIGYTQSEVDPCVFQHTLTDNRKSYVGLYVDDILHFFPKGAEKEEKRFKDELKKAFKISEKGTPEWFIGLKITRCPKHRIIHLSQETKIEQLIVDFEMENCKAEPTPMIPDIKLEKEPQFEKRFNTKLYQAAIGSLIYIMTSTRPDIAFAVSKLSQYMAKPYDSHWKAVKRVIKYLKSTKELGITLGGHHSEERVDGYADADWANDKDGKSITGTVIFYNNSIVTWKSKKQSTVALSTAEAELYALSSTLQEAIWIKMFLEALNINIAEAKIHEDNTSTIKLVENDKKDGRTKHINVKHKFIGQIIRTRPYKLRYIATDKQIADILTKPLSKIKFIKMRSLLGLTLPGECCKVEKEKWTASDAS